MAPFAVTFVAGSGVRRIALRAGERVVIGRSRESDLWVNSPRLSRSHCAVKLGDRGLVLQDLGSANGSFVNGQRVQEALLRPGDIVQVGGVAIRLDFEAASQALDLRCERCERLVSMARCEDGQVFELGKQFVCSECAAILQHQNMNQTEQHLAALLAADGFAVEGKSPLSAGIIPVFKARRLDLDAVVAIKTLPLGASVSKKKIARFQVEARAAAKVRHPNVVEIYDIRQRDHALYIVMEHVEGELLLDHLERKGPLKEPEALRIGILVARALACAHEQGIVHRDLKPGGIVLCPGGSPKVTDFGLAKDVWAITGDITGPEETLGTVRYMPPEQVKNAREVDHRADIYALGATLFHLVAGAPPYSDRAELELMGQVLSGTLPVFDPGKADISPALARVLTKAMAHERAARYANAAELDAALGAVVVETLGVEGFKGDPLLLLSLGKTQPGESTWRGPAPAGGMAGVFGQDELLEVLQMVEFNKKTGTLKVEAAAVSGHLGLQDGRVRAAVTGDGRRGEAAVSALLGVRGGRFEFVPKLPPGFTAQMDAGLSSLVLEALRRRDEESVGG